MTLGSETNFLSALGEYLSWVSLGWEKFISCSLVLVPCTGSWSAMLLRHCLWNLETTLNSLLSYFSEMERRSVATAASEWFSAAILCKLWVKKRHEERVRAKLVCFLQFWDLIILLRRERNRRIPSQVFHSCEKHPKVEMSLLFHESVAQLYGLGSVNEPIWMGKSILQMFRTSCSSRIRKLSNSY